MQEIAEPWINRRNEYIAQQEMLAQRSAGMRGMNYDPEESDYDEAYGPQDRVVRQSTPGENVGIIPDSDYDKQQANAEERRQRGEN
jgi:hypothetical protein